MSRVIVVGVDSIERSSSALLWAAPDARPGLDVVHVVHAYSLLALTGSSWAPAVRANDALRSQAHHVVAAATTAVRVAGPGVEVDGSAIVGKPITVLTDISHLVDLLVVGGGDPTKQPGSRGRGGRIPRVIATRSACPVVVTPGAESHGPAPTDLPVALLLDGTALPRQAIDFAFTAAARRHALLVVAQSFPPEATDRCATADEITLWETSRQKELDAELSTWQQSYRDIGVIVELRRESTLATVQLMHRTTQLIIVTREATDGPALGRLGLTALANATRPVVIVPEASRRQSPRKPCHAPTQGHPGPVVQPAVATR